MLQERKRGEEEEEKKKKKPRAVDDDLYKIPPELLCQIPKKATELYILFLYFAILIIVYFLFNLYINKYFIFFSYSVELFLQRNLLKNFWTGCLCLSCMA